MNTKSKLLPCILAIGLSACTTLPPTGPSVMVLPGTNSTFDRFRQDQAFCQQYALDSIGGRTPAQAAADSAVNSAAAGTAVGAAAGAVIGAASHDPASGAAAGAGVGLLAGSTAGIAAYDMAAHELQDRYDTAFVQCMYANGHQVPLPASYGAVPSGNPAAPPPRAANPVPPGYYPPPPPNPPGPS